MRITTIICYLLFSPFLLLSYSNIASAAEKLYQIDILIFEQADKSALGQEWWPDNPGSPTIHHNNQHSQINQPSFIPAKKLKKPGNVTVLLHTAWQQPIGDKNHSSYIALTNQNNVEGNININSNRFLHADIDLLLQKKMKIIRQKAGLLRVSTNTAAAGDEREVSFRLKQSQKIKLNELRYFDHPAFGIILMVSPVE